MNTIGKIFRFTSFGESHGPAVGGVIDGCPAGVTIDFQTIESALQERSSANGSGRKEADKVEFLSGIFEGKSLGTPIAFIIRNTDVRSGDYEALRDKFRPGHADYTWTAKYGSRDFRGGGRASARETVARVVAGAIAGQILAQMNVRIEAWVSAIGPQSFGKEDTFESYAALIDKSRREHDSLGGVVSVEITGMPAGVGEPVFNKLTSVLAAAMMSIPATRGVEFGDGFAAPAMKGSESIDNPEYIDDSGRLVCRSNHAGGISGGISTGMPITMRVAFKPVATMPGRELETVDSCGKRTTICMQGRHDACVVPRAVPIVRSMAAIVLLDMILQNRCSRL